MPKNALDFTMLPSMAYRMWLEPSWRIRPGQECPTGHAMPRRPTSFFRLWKCAEVLLDVGSSSLFVKLRVIALFRLRVLEHEG